MTQLALHEITGHPFGLLHPQMLYEALPTALKVRVGHQGEPEVPIRERKRWLGLHRQHQGTSRPHRHGLLDHST